MNATLKATAHGGDYRLRITIEPNVTAEFPIAVNDAQAKRKSVPPPRYTLELIATPKKPISLAMVFAVSDSCC